MPHLAPFLFCLPARSFLSACAISIIAQRPTASCLFSVHALLVSSLVLLTCGGPPLLRGDRSQPCAAECLCDHYYLVELILVLALVLVLVLEWHYSVRIFVRVIGLGLSIRLSANKALCSFYYDLFHVRLRSLIQQPGLFGYW